MVVVEELQDVERAHVKRLERDVPAEAEKRQQFWAKRWETKEIAIRRLAENGDLLHELQFKVASVTAD